jgi:hypothetical protein
VLILLAECPDGFGSPHFFPWFRHKDPDVLERELRANYQIYGQTAHAVLTKTRACRVILVSSLPPDDVEAMGMTPAPSLTEAIRTANGFSATAGPPRHPRRGVRPAGPPGVTMNAGTLPL